jgi:zinc ribbon protein
MALVKCPECGRDVASDAPACPNCGTPIAARARVAAQQRSRSKGFLFIMGLVVFIIIGYAVSNKPKQPAQPSGPPPIAYLIQEEWKIPAGGYGRTIVIDSAYRNESDLRRLGEQLRNADPWAKNVFIDVYDHRGAAMLRQAGMSEKLPRKAQAEHDRHRIGVYTRNGNTGFHEWVIAPDGMVGKKWKTITIRYDSTKT